MEILLKLIHFTYFFSIQIRGFTSNTDSDYYFCQYVNTELSIIHVDTLHIQLKYEKTICLLSIINTPLGL